MNELMNTSLITGLGKELELANEKIKQLEKALDYALQVLKNVDEIGGIDLEIIKIKQMIKGEADVE